jgi:hypothetical protein
MCGLRVLGVEGLKQLAQPSLLQLIGDANLLVLREDITSIFLRCRNGSIELGRDDLGRSLPCVVDVSPFSLEAAGSDFHLAVTSRDAIFTSPFPSHENPSVVHHEKDRIE